MLSVIEGLKLSSLTTTEAERLISAISLMFSEGEVGDQSYLDGYTDEERKQALDIYSCSLRDMIYYSLKMSPAIIDKEANESNLLTLMPHFLNNVISSCINLYKHDSLGTQLSRPELLAQGFDIILPTGHSLYGSRHFDISELPQEVNNLPKVSK